MNDSMIWRKRNWREELLAMKEVAVGAETDDNVRTWEPGDEQLLPGLPDDITIDLIVPKLPWRSFYALSSASRSWRKSMQSRRGYNARVGTHQTETLVVIYSPWTGDILLYSTTTRRCYKLPRIPGPETGGRAQFMSVAAVDRKIYVLGGRDESEENVAPNRVYVFDPAGQTGWRRCATMMQRKEGFNCGVLDGKIYLFGGVRRRHSICGSEVYDPKVNAWSRIETMPFDRYGYKVVTMGEEMFLHGGESDPCFRHSDLCVEAYHPLKDEWRTVMAYPGQDVFSAKGQLHSMTEEGICVYDEEKRKWDHRHSHSPPFEFLNHNNCRLDDSLSVDGEVFAIGSWSDFPRSRQDSHYVVYQSEAFESDREELSWQQVFETTEGLSFGGTVQL